MIDVALLHLTLRTAHIGAGAVGLVVFWIAVFVRKGSATHIRCGRAFVILAHVVGISAIISCSWVLADPWGYGTSLGYSNELIEHNLGDWKFFFSFLFMASFSLLTLVQVGVHAVKTQDSLRLPCPYWLKGSLLVFAAAGAALVCFAIANLADGRYAILALLGLGGIAHACWNLRFVLKPRSTIHSWFFKHMESMLVAGIVFHIALGLTIANRLVRMDVLHGTWAMLPWTSPILVGIPMIWLWARHYKRKFGEWLR